MRYTLSAILSTLPAVLFTLIVFTQFDQGEYYTRPWQITAVVFLIASILLGLRIPSRRQAEDLTTLSTTRKRFFVYPALAWVFAVIVLFGLSFSPLVLGQDNGDGANGYFECMFFAVSSSVVYSGFAVLVILVNSLLASQLLRFARIQL